jgi:hypothetical protein
MAGAASKAAAISAADRNFSLLIQLLHLIRKTSAWLLCGNGEVIRSIKGTHYHVASTSREVGAWKSALGQPIVLGWFDPARIGK